MPERSIRISNRAEKSARRLDKHLQDRIASAILELATDPFLGKKLKGDFEGLWSLRVGFFRIIYKFTFDMLEIVNIDHRKDVYR